MPGMKVDYSIISFYTGFPSYALLMTWYEFLGPAVHSLMYDANKEVLECETSKRYRPTALSPENEFFFSINSITSGINGTRFSRSL